MQVALIIIASIAGIVVLIGGIIYAHQQYEKARMEQFRSVAAELGLDFYPAGDPVVMEAIGHLRLFNQGHGRKTKNMISGQSDDIGIAIFGYRYVTGGGNNQQTHHQTVISFQSPNLSLPEFELRPEHFFHKLGQALGYTDIDFETHPVFSKRFLLRGPDEAAIREFFKPELLEFFESRQGISLEASGDRLIYYRARKRIKPEEVRAYMEEGFSAYAAMKNA